LSIRSQCASNYIYLPDSFDLTLQLLLPDRLVVDTFGVLRLRLADLLPKAALTMINEKSLSFAWSTENYLSLLNPASKFPRLSVISAVESEAYVSVDCCLPRFMWFVRGKRTAGSSESVPKTNASATVQNKLYYWM
jgi:hypothetical protein